MPANLFEKWEKRMQQKNMMARLFSGAAVAALVCGLAACGATGTAGEEPSIDVNEQTDSTTQGDTRMEHIDEDLLGTWIVDEPGTPTLEFTDAGEVSGTDGCNRIFSTYTVDEAGEIRIAPFAMTKMACIGVDPWLGAVKQVEVAGDELRVFNGAGDEIGQLQRQV